jgi:hypothetical protein
LNTSGTVTALLACAESTTVAVTVVVPLALAGHVTVVVVELGGLKTQSVRAAFHRIEVTEWPSGRIGVTVARVPIPGIAGLFTVRAAPSFVGGPTTPDALKAAALDGVPRPVGPSQPARAVHNALPPQVPLLPTVMSFTLSEYS